MGWPNVLIGVVTYEGKDYVFDDCIAACKNIDYPNKTVVIADNSKGVNYTRKLRRRGYKRVLNVESGEDAYESILNGQQAIIDYFLSHDEYTHLLWVESDLVPPCHALDKLLLHDKPVVGSWYWLGTQIKVPCVMIESEREGEYSRLLGQTGEQNSRGGCVFDSQEVLEWHNSGLKRCVGPGFGFTLMKRGLIEAIPKWQYTVLDNGKKQHSDSWFYYQLQRNGIPVFVDTDLVIPHFPSEWSEAKKYYDRKER